jgi:hypothetical protein
MRGATSILAGAAFLALAGLAAAQPATPPPPSSPPVAAGDCPALAGLRIEDTNLLSATPVPAADGLQAYCRVLGYVRPAINFEVRLPVADWNGKFYMVGCGGFCGQVLSERPNFTNAMNFGLRRGYAAATMDSGHWGSGAADGRWAHNNRLAEIDWGTRSVPEVARVSRALVAAFHGRPAQRNYFAGCSTGGRQALMQAQRFPADFDGVIAGAPALDYTGAVATFTAWTTRANAGPNGQRLFDPAKVPLVQRAVSEACDAADGLRDGLVSEPRRCGFDPARLQCAAGANTTAECLTETEVGVLRRWYGGARNSRGEQLYPGGIPLGSEPFWPVWLAGTPERQPLNPAFNRDFLRYMAFPDDPGDAYDPLSFDFDRDPPRLAHMAAIYDATSPDLSGFRARNARLIVYHGWADAIVTPERTVQWFEQATQAAGGRAAMDGFARLFMIPGFDHCGLSPAGPGVSETGFDPLTALERWVEANEAPAQIMTNRPARDGQPAWSRPVCPWPQAARHRGGATTDGANFACVDP